MDQHSALNRSGMFLMAASLAIALFVATQAIAAPDESLAARQAAWTGAAQDGREDTARQFRTRPMQGSLRTAVR